MDEPDWIDDNENNIEPTRSDQPEPEPHAPSANQSREPEAEAPIVLDDIKLAHSFIDSIKAATLDNGGLDEANIERLRNPKPWTPSYASKEEQLSIELYVALGKSSQDTYNKVRDAVMRCFPDLELLSLFQVRKRIADITGVVPVATAMCPNSCIAYTGPLAEGNHCYTVHHRPPGQSYKNPPFSRAILFLSLQKLYHHVHTV